MSIQHSSSSTVGRPHSPTDSIWVASRARNALRHPARTILLGAALSVCIMALLIFLPRQSQRQVAMLLPDEQEWQDTVPFSQALASRREAVRVAEADLAATRDSAILQRSVVPPPAPVLTAEERAQSDSLRRVSDELEGMLERVQSAPLLASYRMLGETEALRNEPEVRAILDSLADVERRRETFGAAGGTDPVYVALTSRANELGREIQSVARDQLERAREALARLHRPRGAVHPLLRIQPVDTTAAVARVALAREQARMSLDSLEVAVIMNREYVRRLTAARRAEVSSAPPLSVLLAGVVVGFALAYLAALASEMRRPHVGSVAEVERLSGARVLSLAGPRHEVAEWNRRRGDTDGYLALLKPGAPAYRSVYLHLTATGAVVRVITVTGPDLVVNGVVAANIAVAAAHDGRATLLVDLDSEGAASRAVTLPPRPGVASVRSGEIEWAEGVSSIHIGRGRLLDVIGGGDGSDVTAETIGGSSVPSPDAGSGPRSDSTPIAAAGAAFSPQPSAESLRRGLTRMAGRYDLAVLSAPLGEARKGDAGLLSAPDAIVCVTMGVTTHDMLRTAVEDASGGGLRVVGIVVWDGAPPELPAPRPASIIRRGRTVAATDMPESSTARS